MLDIYQQQKSSYKFNFLSYEKRHGWLDNTAQRNDLFQSPFRFSTYSESFCMAVTGAMVIDKKNPTHIASCLYVQDDRAEEEIQWYSPSCRGKSHFSWSFLAAGVCLPGLGSLLRSLKKHNLGPCQSSPSCPERLLARTVHGGVNSEIVEG